MAVNFLGMWSIAKVMAMAMAMMSLKMAGVVLSALHQRDCGA
jgi:hypothetical protein